MNQVHLFDVSDAVKYGISEAIFIYRIQRWINDNAMSNRDYVFRDGRYWSYSPRDQILKANPYFTAKKLQRIVKKLREENVLEARCDMNQSKVDRTMWYTFTVDEYKRRITLNNTYIEPKQSESDIKPKGQMQEDNLSTPIRTDCPHGPANLSTLPYEIKNKIKNKYTTKNSSSESTQKETKPVLSIPNENINPQDENAKEIINAWNENDALPKVKFNQTIFMALCLLLHQQEQRGIHAHALKNAIKNYVEVVGHRNTWWKSKNSFQAFFGLNKGKPIFERFMEGLFDLTDYVNSDKKGQDKETEKETYQRLSGVPDHLLEEKFSEYKKLVKEGKIKYPI